jgi:hypothetical protein
MPASRSALAPGRGHLRPELVRSLAWLDLARDRRHAKHRPSPGFALDGITHRAAGHAELGGKQGLKFPRHVPAAALRDDLLGQLGGDTTFLPVIRHPEKSEGDMLTGLPAPVGQNVFERGQDNGRVIPQVAECDVAPGAENSPQAFSAAPLLAAARMIMINNPPRSVRGAGPADLALPPLLREHRIELFWSQPIRPQVELPGERGVLLSPELPPFLYIVSSAREAVRCRRPAEFPTGFLQLAPAAHSARQLLITSLGPLVSRLALMFRSAVHRCRTVVGVVVLERMIPYRADALSDVHNSTIHRSDIHRTEAMRSCMRRIQQVGV